jgi:hypothetical protein
MKKLHFILILLFISTNCLFSQNNIIEENIDLSDSFYKGYLDGMYFIKHNTTEDSNDTLAIKKEKLGIILAEGGIIPKAYTSFSVKVPIFNNFHIIPKYSSSSNKEFVCLSLMLGYYFTIDKNKTFLIEGSMGFGMQAWEAWVPIEINLYHRVSKYVLVSFGINYYAHRKTDFVSLAFGAGFTY